MAIVGSIIKRGILIRSKFPKEYLRKSKQKKALCLCKKRH